MRELLNIYIFLLFFVPLSAQIAEDFSDGNYTENPSWEGSLTDFIINSDQQLQLNAANSGESSIYINTFLEKEMEWNFFFKIGFNPSFSNRLRIYLQTDNADLLNSSGYFLEVGETGNIDAIKLYRQDNGTKELLTTATLGAVAEQPNVRIRVTRENEGDWKVLADYSGGNNLELEATANDANYIQSGDYFFGLNCKYTSTRVDGFFFDDISIKALNENEVAPELVDLTLTDEKTITLFFNKPLLENSVTNSANYTIDKGIGNPISANLWASNQIVLTLSTELINNESYTITIENIADLNGNSIMILEKDFSFFKVETAEQYDIIINEIMEDATLDGGGTLGLPAEEYVELYNRSNKALNLEGFVFSDGSARVAEFPSYIMQPNSYLIIGKTSASLLADFGNFLGLPNFPTLSLEEELFLKNEFGEAVDVVSYTQDWYGSRSSAGGSYSLERINYQNPCAGATNWQGATSFLGGTPGSENSVIDLTTQRLLLNLINAYPVSPTQIKLTFDKAVNVEDLMEVFNFSISNNEIIALSLIENNFQEVFLELQNPLIENQIEKITINTSLSDCIGNPIDGQLNLPIALPVLANANDIIINEILFNPQTGGVDFVEIFNRSEKVIDLNSFFIANQALANPQIEPVEVEKLLFPKEYTVFTESPSDIQNRYTVENPTALFAQDLPSFADKDGNVSIYTNDGLTTIFIDEFDYTADFHNALLNDKNGVSLERINPDLPTQSEGNWHSASIEVGYATPTYQNSQQIQIDEERTTIFSLSSNRISPDGDGFEDLLLINYETEREGYSATIHIYDANGRLIDKIAQNELLSTRGSFKWEGTTLDGQKTGIGIYVLWIEYLNLNGKVEQMKKAIVVAEKL